MKNKHLIYGLTAFSVLAVSASAASSALASSNNYHLKANKGGMRQPAALTETQKSEMESKLAAVKAAIAASDYNAWVKAETAINADSPMLKEVTAENFADYVKKQQEREAEMSAFKAKQDAVKAALSAGDYDAWVAAEKAVNADSPLLSKITSSNFSRYAEADKLRTQADAIFSELGIGGAGHPEGGPAGFGHGFPGDGGRGQHGFNGEGQQAAE